MSARCGGVGSLAGALVGALALALLGACASRPKLVSSIPVTPSPKPELKEAAMYNVQLGIAYMERGELETAQDKLLRALKENPRDPDVHSALALLYERLGELGQAEDEFHDAMRLAPRDPDVSNNYAVFLCRTHRVAQGVKRLLATAHDPLYATPEAAYTNAAVCLHSVHEDTQATTYLERAIALRPSFSEAVFQLANLEMVHGKLAAARARIERFMASYPATPELLGLAVRVTRAQGDTNAEQRYERTLRRDFPHSDEARALASTPPVLQPQG